jgi:capsular polysaccharide biosynthesis protein
MRHSSRILSQAAEPGSRVDFALNHLAAIDSPLASLPPTRHLMAAADYTHPPLLDEARQTALELQPAVNTDQVQSMPMTWLDQCNIGNPTVVSPPEKVRAVGPADSDGRQSSIDLELGPVKAYRFTQAKIHALSSAVVLRDRAIIERPHYGDAQRVNMATGHLLQHGSKRAFLRRYASERLPVGISLAGNAPWNYYHWMMEILPRLLYLDQLDPDTRSWPLLVPQSTLEVPNMVASLASLAPRRDIIPLRHERTYALDQVIVLSAPSLLPLNLRKDYKAGPSDAATRPSAVNALASHVVPRAGALTPSTSRRLFLARGAGIRSYNEFEIEEVLKDLGFETVYIGQYPLRYQARLFASAEFLVGASGAAWTNLIFASGGTRALSWLPTEVGDFPGYSTLASIRNVDLRFVYYQTGVTRTGDVYDRGYYLNPDVVRAAVEQMLSEM